MKKELAENEIYERDFPSVKLAYPLAMESYKTSRERFDTMEKRGQSIVVFVTTISLAIITIVSKDRQISFFSFWFILASLSYVTTLVLGIISQTAGKLMIPDPNELINKSTLTWSEWEFQKNMIYIAGENFKHNHIQIERRANFIKLSTIFGFITLFSLAFWVCL